MVGYEAILINVVATIFIVGVGLVIIHRTMNNRCLTREEYERDIEKKVQELKENAERNLQEYKEYMEARIEMFSQLVDEKIAKVLVKLEMIERYMKNQINRLEERIYE